MQRSLGKVVSHLGAPIRDDPLFKSSRFTRPKLPLLPVISHFLPSAFFLGTVSAILFHAVFQVPMFFRSSWLQAVCVTRALTLPSLVS